MIYDRPSRIYTLLFYIVPFFIRVFTMLQNLFGLRLETREK